MDDRAIPHANDRDSLRFADLRRQMVDHQLVARGIRDEHVLEAMRQVPRHAFVPTQWWSEAYEDWPLPIGFGQTISLRRPFHDSWSSSKRKR